jgi:hypothetical protein
MATCEKCWEDAYLKSKLTGRSQSAVYFEIKREREIRGEICSAREQAGQFWNEEEGVDSRALTAKQSG